MRWAVPDNPRYTNLNKSLCDEKKEQEKPVKKAVKKPMRRVALSDGLRKEDVLKEIHDFTNKSPEYKTYSTYSLTSKEGYMQGMGDWQIGIKKLVGTKQGILLKRENWAYPGELILAEWGAANLSDWRSGIWLLKVHGDEFLEDMKQYAKQLEAQFHVKVNIRVVSHEKKKRRIHHSLD